MYRLTRNLLGACVAVLVPVGCSTPTTDPGVTNALSSDPQVHCLLPSQVRTLGNITYPARRRLVYDTAQRCTIRGGEYTVYDRASAQNSEAFYQPLAEQGDAEAQFHLGLVYESLFNPPNYDKAAQWYERAAQQSHTYAQKNLAFLYEKGLGVEADAIKSVNLLRQAGGISDELVLASEMDAAKSELQREVLRLTGTLDQQNSQTAELQRALARANNKLLNGKQQLETQRQQLAATMIRLQDMEGQKAQAGSMAEQGQVQEQLRSQQRQVAQQELTIAELEADLGAQRALLHSSETKARLQEQQLTERIEEAESVKQERNAVVAALQGKDLEIGSLTSRLNEVRDTLAGERSKQQTLLSELQKSQQGAEAAGVISQQVQTLLAQVSERDQAITVQAKQISTLELQSQASETASREQLGQLNNQLAGLERELQEQRSSYQALQTQFATGQEQTDDATKAQLTRLQSQIAEREALVQQQTMQVQELQGLAERATLAIDALQADNERKVDEIDFVNAKLAAIEARLLERQVSVADLEAELAAEQQASQSHKQARAQLVVELQDQETKTEGFRQLQQQLASREKLISQKDGEISKLQSDLQASKNELLVAQSERSMMLVTRSRRPKPQFPSAPDIDLPPGNKYALLIGNDDYSELGALTTAGHGATEIATILDQEYGFKTTLLTNATKRQITDEFAVLARKLEPDDYVLIYYAGHGDVDPSDKEVSYWLPVDARSNRMFLKSDGIESQWITSQLAAMQARHVMVIADSCYSGAMVRPPRVSTPRMNLDERRLSYMLGSRSRTVLSSGANAPVLDSSYSGQHSLFTQALIDVLKQNPDIIYGEALHAALVELVKYNADQVNFPQTPQFSEISDAKHGNGQFVLKAQRRT